MFKFDATINFLDVSLLTETMLTAEAEQDSARNYYYTAVVLADSEDDLGTVYGGDELLPELAEDDWCVSGVTLADVAAALAECMMRA